MANNNTEIKKNGIFYTPANLAEFLVHPIISGSGLKLLDPSYGEGSLLLAAEKIAKKKRHKATLKLHGCDIKPVNGLLKHLPEANLKKIDFFDFSTVNKFDAIIMNPPFIRHHNQDNNLVQKYRSRFPGLDILSQKSDIWAYFLLKAVMHLNHQGNIAAILPWSFMQADYSKEVRSYLASIFEHIEVVGLNGKYFKDAQARIVVLWLRAKGLQNKEIKFATMDSLKDSPDFKSLTSREWAGDNRVAFSKNKDFDLLSRLADKYNFIKLSNVCEIKIGVVSGADKFFLLKPAQKIQVDLDPGDTIRIISGVKQFPLLLNEQYENIKRLLLINEYNVAKFENYIGEGESQNYNLRLHCKRRRPWYKIFPGAIPDAFFPYLITKLPFLVYNNSQIQCTNSIHRIYFKGLSRTEIRWIEVSLLSCVGQLSLEFSSKTYGKGMMKIEPSSLKQALVFRSNDYSINQPYEIIINKLRQNKPEAASKIATSFLADYLGMSTREVNTVKRAVKTIQEFRLGG